MGAKLVFMLLAVVVSIPGCKDLGEDARATDWYVYVLGKTWTLYALQINGVPIAIPSGQPYLLWFEDDKNYRGTSHCNSCFGTYSLVQKGSIRFSTLVCTERLCPPPSLSDTFQHALQRVSAYQFEEGILVLLADNATTALRFYRNIR